MRELVSDSAAELLSLAFYGVVTLALTVLGAVTELAARHDLAAGNTALGGWELGMGILLLYAGFYAARTRFVPQLAGASSE